MNIKDAGADFARVHELIAQAAQRGIMLWVEDGRLKFSGPVESMSAELREDLSSVREYVIAELSRPVFKRLDHRPHRLRLPHWLAGFWQATRSSQSLASSTHMIVQLAGNFTMDSLQAALEQVIARHDLLTMRFAETEGPGTPVLVFDTHFEPAIQILDASVELDAARGRVAKLIEKTMWARFEDGPVFRACLIKLADRKFIFAFVLHHVVADFRSCEIVLREFLFALLHGIAGTAPAKPRPIQYVEYLLGLGDWLSGPALPYRIAFWKQKLRRAPRVRLSPDYEPTPTSHPGVERLDFSIAPALRARIASTASTCNVALYVTLLAAQFASLWSRLNQRDLMISTVMSGRDDPALEGLVGNTIECVPVRVSVREEMTFRDLVKAVGEEYRLACSYNVPRNMMIESLREIAAELAAPLFNFIISGAPTPAAPIPVDTNGVRIQLIDFKGPEQTVGTEWKSHDLHMYDSGTAMRGFVNYRPAIYRRQTIEGFLDTMFEWLEALADGPRRQMGDWRDDMQRGCDGKYAGVTEGVTRQYSKINGVP